jgi:hypothetical protein
MPVTPLCQLGLAVKVLVPPPPDEIAYCAPFDEAVEELSSFQTCSGIYDFAELITSLPLADSQ